MQKCRHIKGLPYILLALAAGVLLLLLPGKSAESPAATPHEAEAYRRALEQEVQELLLELPEVKSCSVVLTLSYGYEYLYATDQRVSETSGGKQTEKTIVLATESGNEIPIPLREKQPVVCGAAVVCPGANEATRMRIEQLLRALFSLESTAISIIP